MDTAISFMMARVAIRSHVTISYSILFTIILSNKTYLTLMFYYAGIDYLHILKII